MVSVRGAAVPHLCGGCCCGRGGAGWRCGNRCGTIRCCYIGTVSCGGYDTCCGYACCAERGSFDFDGGRANLYSSAEHCCRDRCAIGALYGCILASECDNFVCSNCNLCDGLGDDWISVTMCRGTATIYCQGMSALRVPTCAQRLCILPTCNAIGIYFAWRHTAWRIRY